MPSFDWKSEGRPWVSQVSQDQNKSRGRSPHAYDPRYKTKRWRVIRQQVLMDNPLCLECNGMGRVTPARVIDHIIPVRSGGEFFDLSNLQPLCDKCHNSKSGKESHGIPVFSGVSEQGGRGSQHFEGNQRGNVEERAVDFGTNSRGGS